MPEPSAAHRLRVALLRAADRVAERAGEALGAHGLTQPQFNALRVLRGRAREEAEASDAGAALGSFSTSDLRERLLTRAADTPRLVDRLVRKGWVSKKPCDHDARRVHLALTDAGAALLTTLDREMAAFDEATVPLAEADAARLADALERFLAAFDA